MIIIATEYRNRRTRKNNLYRPPTGGKTVVNGVEFYRIVLKIK